MKTSTPSMAQAQLKKTRDEFRALLFTEQASTDKSDSFPRSIIMRWLLNGGGKSFAKLSTAIPLIMRIIPLVIVVQRFFNRDARR
jgi:hypothetical protein